MRSYLAFLHSGIEAYTGRSQEDGKNLARCCLERLKDLKDDEQFPPRLLILLTSPAYLDLLKAGNLLAAINEAFADAGHLDVPLIGCSTAAVFFNRRAHPQGALLICLASRLLKAEVAIGMNAIDEPERAVDDLLRNLKLHAGEGEDPNPFANRSLLTFLPGFYEKKYLAPSLHKLLRRKLYARIPIFGGGATADSPDRVKPGVLFTNQEARRDAIVAARITCGTPLGVSLSHGLTITDRLLRVTNSDEKKNEIYRFYETPVAALMQELEEKYQVALLAEIAANRHPVIENPKLTDSGQALQMMRNIHKDAIYKVIEPEPEKIHKAVLDGVKYAKEQARVENPIVCLAFKCNGLLRNRQKIGIDFEREFAEVEEQFGHRQIVYVGAFVDGEAGVDDDGRSLFRNWSTAATVIGDELSASTPSVRGFKKLADLARKPMAEPDEAVNRALRMIHEIGFPGAMISSWLPDQHEEKEMIVARDAVGSRYRKEKELKTACPALTGENVLSQVARDREPRFIRDSRDPASRCDRQMVERSGVISQYIIPLTNLRGKVNHVLQIDLGDVSHKSELRRVERQALNALGGIIASILNHVFSGHESRITLGLDRAMKECLSADTLNEGLQLYLDRALKAFGLEMGHIRMAREDKKTLALVAGAGRYYEAIRHSRSEIDFGNVSPIALSFREGRSIVINDAANNDVHRALRESLRKVRERDEDKKGGATIEKVMENVGSFACVPFRGENNERGAICLVTKDPWFFNWFHVGAIEALGERLGFLADALRQKQRRRLLHSLNHQHSGVRTPDNPEKVLERLLDRFASEMNADFAAIFLWDEDRELNVLRAQYRWREPQWVGAAHYYKGDAWTGSAALAGQPRFIPDLRKFYEDQGYPKGGNYSRQIFGEELSDDFSVEAIGLPLEAGDKQIGVVTLYRRINGGHLSGFPTTDVELLRESADNLAELIRLIESNRQAEWEKEELLRQQKVYQAFAAGDGDESFAKRVCRRATEVYQAISADFYLVDSSELPPQITWETGYRAGSEAEPSPVKPDDLARRAASVSQSGERRTHVSRYRATDEDLKDPRRAGANRSIERVCVPLGYEEKVVGLLDLKWSPEQTNYRHSKIHLQLLGEVVGAAYSQHRIVERWKQAEELKRKAEIKQKQTELMQQDLDEQSDRAIKATGAYAFQSIHRIGNVVQDIYSNYQVISDSPTNEKKRENAFGRLGENIQVAQRMVDSLKDAGKRVADLRSKPCNLGGLINQALNEIHPDKICGVAPQISFDSLFVDVDPELTRQVLINLLENAFNAMSGQSDRSLRLNAVATDVNTVELTISDNGYGMTQQEIQAALRGFFTTGDHKGVGVLISRVLLTAQGGSLRYSSVKSKGTKTIITLPLAHKQMKVAL
jgi:signal transduction histidine kinase/GAF domain-containing protein